MKCPGSSSREETEAVGGGVVKQWEGINATDNIWCEYKADT